jgi:hypothetical protein
MRHAAYAQGYDSNAVSPSIRADKEPPRPNGWLTYGKHEVPLWVFDVATSFAMSGSTAQSPQTRTYFARNFTQGTITVSVQLPTQVHLGRLTEFVRRTHRGMQSSTMLEIVGGGPSGNFRRRLKYGGPSFNIAAEGYIRSIPREHMRFVYSPELAFEFVVERLIAPSSWADTPVNIRRLKSWHDIVEGVLKHDKNAGFEGDPDANVDTSGQGSDNVGPNEAGFQFGGARP